MDEEAGRTLPGISGDHCPTHTLTVDLRPLDLDGIDSCCQSLWVALSGTQPQETGSKVCPQHGGSPSHRAACSPGISCPTWGLWNCCTWLWLAPHPHHGLLRTRDLTIVSLLMVHRAPGSPQCEPQ